MGMHLRLILTGVLIVVLGGVFFAQEAQKEGRVQAVFCDVGQGDGFVIFGGGGGQIVFDSGLGSKMIDCLGRYMPFWDRKIEIMVITHPQKDHMEGQIEILERYKVGHVLWTGALGSGGLFEDWEKLVREEEAQLYPVARGDRIEFGDVNFEILWPTKSFMDLWKLAAGSDLNETSIVARMNYGNICAYLTGDVPVEKLEDVIDKNCQILKVAHHGSKSGTSDVALYKMQPKIAVIQVGQSNSYGHPKREVIESLNKFGVKILRNDIQGDVLIQFGNGSYEVKSRL